MRSFFVKGSLVLALAAAFGMPNASAAPLVAVEPTVAVVDGNHAAIVGANGLLNAFIQNHPNAGITERRMKCGRVYKEHSVLRVNGRIDRWEFR